MYNDIETETFNQTEREIVREIDTHVYYKTDICWE